MQGRIGRFGQRLVGGDGQERVRRLHRDLVIAEIEILENAGMVQRTFHHRLGTGLAVFFQQVFFQRTGIHADANGTAMIARGLDDIPDPVHRADIARIDAQAGGAGLCRLNAALVVEMIRNPPWQRMMTSSSARRFSMK